MARFARPLLAALAAAAASAVAAALAVAIWMFAVVDTDALSAVLGAPFLFLYLFLYAFAIALPHALLIGLPAYALLRLKWRLCIRRSMLAGFLIGASTMPLINLLSTSVSGILAGSEGGLMVEGIPPDPYYNLALLVGASGVFGLIGGLAFWRVVRERTPAGDPA